MGQWGMTDSESWGSRWPVGSIGWLYGTIGEHNPSVGEFVAARVLQQATEPPTAGEETAES